MLWLCYTNIYDIDLLSVGFVPLYETKFHIKREKKSSLIERGFAEQKSVVRVRYAKMSFLYLNNTPIRIKREQLFARYRPKMHDDFCRIVTRKIPNIVFKIQILPQKEIKYSPSIKPEECS